MYRVPWQKQETIYTRVQNYFPALHEPTQPLENYVWRFIAPTLPCWQDCSGTGNQCNLWIAVFYTSLFRVTLCKLFGGLSSESRLTGLVSCRAPCDMDGSLFLISRADIFSIYPKIFKELLANDDADRQLAPSGRLPKDFFNLPSDYEWKLKVYFRLLEMQRKLNEAEERGE